MFWVVKREIRKLFILTIKRPVWTSDFFVVTVADHAGFDSNQASRL